jgi:hypothetical protein
MLAVTLALTLLAAGCGAITEQPATLRLGFDSLDGPFRVWPARGNLATDSAVSAAVTAAVQRWRTPTGDRAHLPSSGILWLGEVDKAPLALVAATVPGGDASWLLQVSRRDGAFEVTRTARYTEPGYLVYADVLPVSLASGRRYLASARVEQIVGPDGNPLQVTDGLSASVDAPRCSAITVTASLHPTESLPAGKPAYRLIDLGTATEDPRYPLVADDSGAGAKALKGLDTCSLAAKNGPFGSIPQRSSTGRPADGVPMSWPFEQINARSLEDFTIDQDPPARLEQLSWHTNDGVMTALVYRTETGAPLVSLADRARTLQAYVLPVPGRTLVALVWRPAPDTTLALPPDTSKLVDKPGLVIVPKSGKNQTFSLVTPDKTHYRSVTDRADGTVD